MADQNDKKGGPERGRRRAEKGDKGIKPGPDSGGPGNNPKQPNLMSRGMLGWILLIGLAVVLLVLMNHAQNRAEVVTQDEFLLQAENGRFSEVTLEETRAVGKLREGVAGQAAATAQTPQFVATKVHHQTRASFWLLLRDAVKDQPGFEGIREETGNNWLFQILIAWGPIILIAFLIYFFVFRSLRNAGGGPGMLGNFGRSKHKVLTKEHSNITLDDVAGVDEAKEEVGEIIEFLKNPKKFQRLGGRVPRGVLLIGSPGCGKTLLAKAVAGEAEVPFFSISGSDFVEMFVGVGASRVRDLFKQAKESSPCIIFLDEIDAVGRKRGAGFSSGGHDEREQTLNAILVEMDGFDSSDQVIVMAATNRADVLDPALIRPGRFDRQINVPLPDIRGRLEILKVHSRKVKMSPDVDLEKLARGTPMFSGAELAAIVNEAAIGATLRAKDFVEQDDLEEARDKVRWGRSRKSHKIEEDEKRVIAYHEAGHAVVMYYDEYSEPLHKVTIIPRGPTMGATYMLPERDRYIASRNQLLARMRSAFGGRIAEEMFTGDKYNGTGGDIRMVMNIARAMVTEYGMSDRVGFRFFGDDEQRQPWESANNHGDETAQIIDEEVKRIIDEQYAVALKFIEDHRRQVDDLAKALLKHESLAFDEVDRIMKGEPLDKATVEDLIEAEKDKPKTHDRGVTIRPDNPGLDNDTGQAMPSPA